MLPAVRLVTAGSSAAAAADAVRALVDLVLPGGCAGCAAPGRAICSACLHQLGAPAAPVRPTPAPPGLPLVWATAAYAGVVRSVVLAHKERGRLALAGPLGTALAHALEATLEVVDPASTPLGVVPVPSRRDVVRSRGHDATARMARHAVATLRRSGYPVELLPVLRVQRRVVDQAGLRSSQRTANVAGALGVPRRYAPLVAGRLVVVVDDVVTTGASLAEAARAVRAAHGTVVAAAVVAATSRRVPLWRGAGLPGLATGD